MPLPDTDFDTTEVAVPWRLLTDLGHSIVFATEHGGTAPSCDPRLLTGVIFGKLGRRPRAARVLRSADRRGGIPQPGELADGRAR